MNEAAAGPRLLQQQLLEAIPATTYVARAADRGQLVYVSPQVESMLGRTPEEFLSGRVRWDTLIHPDDHPAFLAQTGRSTALQIAPGDVLVLTYRMRTHDGRVRWVRDHGRLACDGSGLQYGVVLDVTVQVEAEAALRRARDLLEAGILDRTRELSDTNAKLQQEITERREAEQSLRHSEELYRLLAEHSTDLISKHSPDGRFVYSSPACWSLLGYEPEELIGRSAYEYHHPEDLAAIRLSHETILRQPDVYTVEYRFRRKDGNYTWLETTSKTIRDPRTGDVLEIIAASRDISARKRAEDERRLLHLELTHVARLTTLGEMASGLAHELNQPLAAISNYLEAARRLMAGDAADDGAATRALEAAVSEAHRAGEIIRRMRSMARRAPEHAAAADLNELLREVVELCAAEVRAAGAEVVLELAPSLPLAKLDRIAIGQVLVNLVRNGLDAMQGTTGRARVLTLGSAVVDDSLEVTVRDTGCGLSETALVHMFDPFFTTKPDGLGMGLPISQTIIETHKGRLWAEADPRGGTVFRFALPRSGA